jgi:hypothetical protein
VADDSLLRSGRGRLTTQAALQERVWAKAILRVGGHHAEQLVDSAIARIKETLTE